MKRLWCEKGEHLGGLFLGRDSVDCVEHIDWDEVDRARDWVEDRDMDRRLDGNEAA
jgi:hypothetical protein